MRDALNNAAGFVSVRVVVYAIVLAALVYAGYVGYLVGSVYYRKMLLQSVLETAANYALEHSEEETKSFFIERLKSRNLYEHIDEILDGVPIEFRFSVYRKIDGAEVRFYYSETVKLPFVDYSRRFFFNLSASAEEEP